MPQFLADYNEWWIQFWLAHPILFWAAFVVFGTLAAWPMLWRKW